MGTVFCSIVQAFRMKAMVISSGVMICIVKTNRRFTPVSRYINQRHTGRACPIHMNDTEVENSAIILQRAIHHEKATLEERGLPEFAADNDCTIRRRRDRCRACLWGGRHCHYGIGISQVGNKDHKACDERAQCDGIGHLPACRCPRRCMGSSRLRNNYIE